MISIAEPAMQNPPFTISSDSKAICFSFSSDLASRASDDHSCSIFVVSSGHNSGSIHSTKILEGILFEGIFRILRFSSVI